MRNYRRESNITVIRFINDTKFSANRRFYDFFLREIVCSIYAKDFDGLNTDLELPYYHGRTEWDYYKTIGEVFSSKQINALNNVISEIRKSRLHNLPDLKNTLLEHFPTLTTCHLDGLNYMQCIS